MCRCTRSYGHLLLRAGGPSFSLIPRLEMPRDTQTSLSPSPATSLLPWLSRSHRPSAAIAAPRCPCGHSPPLASLAVQPLRQDVAGLSIEASELGTRCSVSIVLVFNVGHRREPPSICRLPVVPELFEPQFYSL